jgi:hypothetical protein
MTVRRLGPGEAENVLWAGTEGARQFLPLARLLAEALPAGTARPTERHTGAHPDAAASPAPGVFPDRIQAAVRHVCLVLGVYPAAALSKTQLETRAFSIESVAPAALGVSPKLLTEESAERLRAHAAVAVARTLPAFAMSGLLDSPDALESARKAALALARGAVSGSPLYRPLVSQLGPRRSELADALALAENTTAAEFWRGVELTIARLALLCSVDRDAVLHAAEAVPFSASAQEIAAELDAFERSPGFGGYWHKLGTGSA